MKAGLNTTNQQHHVTLFVGFDVSLLAMKLEGKGKRLIQNIELKEVMI